MKKSLVALLCALLGACSLSGLSGKAPLATYDFGVPAAPSGNALSWPYLSLDVNAPDWIDSSMIAYRLAYEAAQKLRQYTTSRWVGPPSQMLSERLQYRLGVQADGDSTPGCLLRLELQEFSQIFDDAQRSHALLLAQVRLLDKKRRLLHERRFRIEIPATTPDAQGGVVALASAVEGLGSELERWLKETAQSEQSGQLNSCRPPVAAG